MPVSIFRKHKFTATRTSHVVKQCEKILINLLVQKYIERQSNYYGCKTQQITYATESSTRLDGIRCRYCWVFTRGDFLLHHPPNSDCKIIRSNLFACTHDGVVWEFLFLIFNVTKDFMNTILFVNIPVYDNKKKTNIREFYNLINSQSR